MFPTMRPRIRFIDNMLIWFKDLILFFNDRCSNESFSTCPSTFDTCFEHRWRHTSSLVVFPLPPCLLYQVKDKCQLSLCNKEKKIIKLINCDIVTNEILFYIPSIWLIQIKISIQILLQKFSIELKSHLLCCTES